MKISIIKKTTILLCAFLIIGNITMPTFASATSIEADATGISLSKNTFTKMFSGNPEQRIDTYDASDKVDSSKISLQNICISEDKVEMDILLGFSDQSEKFHIEGQLQASYKTQNGVNSAILNVTDTTGCEILLFEIFNDDASDNLLVNRDLNGIPHIKVYLEDKAENLFMFEMELPIAFSDIQALQYAEAEIDKDSLWAKDLVQWETEELETTDELLEEMGLGGETLLALGSYSTWTNPTTYHKSCYLGSDKADYYSLPYVTYRHVNVTPQDSTWDASFLVAEHAQIANVTYYGVNPIEYRNVKIAYACGDRTHILRMYQDGTIKNGNAIIVKGQKITLQILSKLVSSLPGGATISTVLNYINTMTGSNQNISLGSDAIGLSSNLTVAAGIQLTGAEAIMKDTNAGGHLLKTQAVLSYYGSTSGSVNTIGAIKVDFTKYDVEDTSSVSGSTSMQLNYKASNP